MPVSVAEIERRRQSKALPTITELGERRKSSFLERVEADVPVLLAGLAQMFRPPIEQAMEFSKQAALESIETGKSISEVGTKKLGETALGFVPGATSIKQLIEGKDPLSEHPLLTAVDVGFLALAGLGIRKPLNKVLTKAERVEAPIVTEPTVSPSDLIKTKSANVTLQTALTDLERQVERLGPTPPKVGKGAIPTEVTPEGKVVEKPKIIVGAEELNLKRELGAKLEGKVRQNL